MEYFVSSKSIAFGITNELVNHLLAFNEAPFELGVVNSKKGYVKITLDEGKTLEDVQEWADRMGLEDNELLTWANREISFRDNPIVPENNLVEIDGEVYDIPFHKTYGYLLKSIQVDESSEESVMDIFKRVLKENNNSVGFPTPYTLYSTGYNDTINIWLYPLGNHTLQQVKDFVNEYYGYDFVHELIESKLVEIQ